MTWFLYSLDMVVMLPPIVIIVVIYFVFCGLDNNYIGIFLLIALLA